MDWWTGRHDQLEQKNHGSDLEGPQGLLSNKACQISVLIERRESVCIEGPPACRHGPAERRGRSITSVDVVPRTAVFKRDLHKDQKAKSMKHNEAPP